MSKLTWNEETSNALTAKAQATGTAVISQEAVIAITAELAGETGKEVTARSVGSKLRKLGFDVQKASETAKSAWTDEEDAALVQFVTDHSGEYTYAEIASAVAGGKFTAKQVQGKILSKELTANVKKTEKVAAQRSYTPDEEAQFISLVEAGKFVEELAEHFGRTTKQVRGKALSLLREERISQMPKQKETSSKAKEDALEGVDVASLSVAEIAAQIGKSERGVRSMLSRRGLTASDYDGAAKRAKLDSKASAE